MAGAMCLPAVCPPPVVSGVACLPGCLAFSLPGPPRPLPGRRYSSSSPRCRESCQVSPPGGAGWVLTPHGLQEVGQEDVIPLGVMPARYSVREIKAAATFGVQQLGLATDNPLSFAPGARPSPLGASCAHAGKCGFNRDGEACATRKGRDVPHGICHRGMCHRYRYPGGRASRASLVERLMGACFFRWQTEHV